MHFRLKRDAVWQWSRCVSALLALALIFSFASTLAYAEDTTTFSPVPLASAPVGAIVKLDYKGELRDFIIVHQGRPSNLYDASCDGTWLLMKEADSIRSFRYDKDNNSYADSTIHKIMNGVILDSFSSEIQQRIKQVKIPYRKGNGNSSTPVSSGSSGLETRLFLLSAKEVGLSDQYTIANDGARLDYFEVGSSGNAKRQAILYGTNNNCNWWLRSPYTGNSNGGSFVSHNGATYAANSVKADGTLISMTTSNLNRYYAGDYFRRETSSSLHKPNLNYAQTLRPAMILDPTEIYLCPDGTLSGAGVSLPAVSCSTVFDSEIEIHAESGGYENAGITYIGYKLAAAQDYTTIWQGDAAASKDVSQPIAANGTYTIRVVNAVGNEATVTVTVTDVGSESHPFPAGNAAIGDTITLNLNGMPHKFIVINQGRPSTLYDSSCDGTWLMAKNVLGPFSDDVSFAGISTNYIASAMNDYLNDTFIEMFDAAVRNEIKTVKIPSRNGVGTTTTVSSGSYGLSTKAFLLSANEVGYSFSENVPNDGVLLPYFSKMDTFDTRRCAYTLNGESGDDYFWVLRTPYTGTTDNSNGYVIPIPNDISSSPANTGSEQNTLFLNQVYQGYYRPVIILPSAFDISGYEHISDENEPPEVQIEKEPSTLTPSNLPVTVKIYATDAGSGIASVWYKMSSSEYTLLLEENGYYPSSCSTSFVAATNDTYSVKVVDACGNETVEEVVVSNIGIGESTLGEVPVGASVILNVAGAPTEFIVVQHGVPDANCYDASCSGTWLLMKNVWESGVLDETLNVEVYDGNSGVWNTSGENDYAKSSIHSTLLNGILLSQLDSAVQENVLTVKIPYKSGAGASGAIETGENGLQTKVFLLSGREVGLYSDNAVPDDGATLAYFSPEAGTNRRIASSENFRGPQAWWLRSPDVSRADVASMVNIISYVGARSTAPASAGTDYYVGIRPAMILPNELNVNENGAIVVDAEGPEVDVEKNSAWTNGNVTVELTLSDIESGVTEVSYKLSTDDSYTILWSGVEDVVETSFTATQNGTYNIRVLDAAGNETIENVQISSIDRVMPNLTYTRTPTSWASENVTINLNVTDADAGVAEVSYKKAGADVFSVLWSGEQNSVNTSFTATENSEYVVKYLDVAGNEATESIQIDKLDNAAPGFVYATDPPQGQRTMESVAVTIAATDSGTPGVDRSGIGEIWYKHASDAEYTLAWSCEDEDGPASQTISFEVADNGVYSIKIVDMAGNQTVDTVSVENITDEVHAGAIPSGLVDPEYSLNNGSTWQTAPDGEATVSVSDGDNYAVRGRSVTGSGMRSDPSGAIPVSIDMQLPIVQAVTRPDAARSSTITVNVMDTQSGIYKICVSKDGGVYEDLFTAAVGTTEPSVYSKTIDYRVTSNGTYTFKAIDVVGNESLPQVTVISTIDREPPVIEDGIPQLVELSGDSSYAVIHLVGRDVGSSGFSHFILPDGTQSANTTVNYRVSESGTYTFHAFDNAGNSASRTVTVSGVRPSSDTSISVTMRTAANYTWDKYTAIGQISDNAIRIPYKESNAAGDVSGTYCRTYNADPYAYPSGGTDPIEWEDETYPHNYTEELESYRGKWVEINGQMYYIEPDAALGDDGNWWYIYGKVVTPQRGSFFNTVSAVTGDAYPENGYLDGYWYTAKPDSSTMTLSNGSDMDFYLNTEGQNDVTMTFACSNVGAKISMFNDEVLNANTHTVHFDIAPNQTVNFTLTVKAVDGSEDSYIVRVHTKNMIPTVRVVNERQINRSVYAETGYAYQSEFVPYGDSTYGIDGVVFEILATDKNVGQFVSGYVTFQGLNYSIQWGEAPNSGVTSYGSKGTEQKGFAIIPASAFSGEGKKDINELVDVVVQDSQTSGGEAISRSNAMSTNVRLHTDVTAPEVSCEMYSTRYALKVRVSDTTSVPHITVTLTPKNGSEPTVLNLTQSELNNAIALTASTEFDVSIEAVDLCGHVGTLNGTTTYVPPRFIPEGGSGDGGEGGTGGSGSGEGGSGSGIPGVDSDFWRIVGENHGISGFQTRNGTYLIINPAGDTRQSNPRTNGHEQNFGLFGNEQ